MNYSQSCLTQTHQSIINNEIVEQDRIVVYIDNQLRDLIPTYIDYKLRDIAIMRRAVKAEDFISVLYLGDHMKGDGGSFGFDFITEKGRELINAAERENSIEIIIILNEILDYLDRIEIVFQEARSKFSCHF